MQFFKRSIQWQLILSMGAALLASLLIVILVYASAVERLAERYLLDEALPANINAIRNDIERTLAAPITATAGIAGNTLVHDWLIQGEDSRQAEAIGRYLNGVKVQQNALTTSVAVLGSGHYYSDAGLSRTLSRSTPADGWFYSGGRRPRTPGGAGRRQGHRPADPVHQPAHQRRRTSAWRGRAGLQPERHVRTDRRLPLRRARRGLSGRQRWPVKIHPRSEHNGRAALAELAGAQAARQLETQAGQVVRFERDGETFRPWRSRWKGSAGR